MLTTDLSFFYHGVIQSLAEAGLQGIGLVTEKKKKQELHARLIRRWLTNRTE